MSTAPVVPDSEPFEVPRTGAETYWARPRAEVDGILRDDLEWEADFGTGYHAPHRRDDDGFLGWTLAGPRLTAEDNPPPRIVVTRSLTPKIRCIDDPEVIVRRARPVVLTE